MTALALVVAFGVAVALANDNDNHAEVREWREEWHAEFVPVVNGDVQRVLDYGFLEGQLVVAGRDGVASLDRADGHMRWSWEAPVDTCSAAFTQDVAFVLYGDLASRDCRHLVGLDGLGNTVLDVDLSDALIETGAGPNHPQLLARGDVLVVVTAIGWARLDLETGEQVVGGYPAPLEFAHCFFLDGELGSAGLALLKFCTPLADPTQRNSLVVVDPERGRPLTVEPVPIPEVSALVSADSRVVVAALPEATQTAQPELLVFDPSGRGMGVVEDILLDECFPQRLSTDPFASFDRGACRLVHDSNVLVIVLDGHGLAGVNLETGEQDWTTGDRVQAGSVGSVIGGRLVVPDSRSQQLVELDLSSGEVVGTMPMAVPRDGELLATTGVAGELLLVSSVMGLVWEFVGE